MARSSANNGKLTSGNRSVVRVMLATGATLATLISAQMFAGSAAIQNAAQVAAVPTTVNTTASTISDDENNTVNLVTTTINRSSIFATQTQPNPGSRSSR